MLLLTHADVFAPQPLGRRSLLIAGERIEWIGAGAPALPRELGVEVVDLGGRRVVPGFVDGHVHLTGGGGEDGFRTRVPPVALSRFTSGGTTTVVGVLGTDDVTRGTAGLVAAARALVEEGMSAWCMTGGYHVPPVTLTGSVRGDLVHVDRVIACGEIAISDHRSSQPTLEEILKLAAEAHLGGMLARKAGLLHLHVGDGARALELIEQAIDRAELPARVFQPTHVNRRKALFEQACALARRGVHVDLTAFPVAPADDAWSAAAALARYLDAGLPADHVTVSSDAGGSLPEFDANGAFIGMGVGSPGALAASLAELLASGQPLERVLPAFTSNAADLLRLSAKGRLAAGGDADLCVLDAQGRVTDVMARGAWHVRDGRVVQRGTFERE